MKRFLIFGLTVLLMVLSLSGCGCDDGRNTGLVFVNDSDATIVSVVADFADRDSGAQNADSSPLKRGDYFGFEAGEYPVTVLVYDRAVGRVEADALARIVIDQAPPEGERWYVTARGGTHGLVLAADIHWPEEVWSGLVDMGTVSVDGKWAVVWEGRIYVPFCVVSKNDRGEQIGYVNGDTDDRISEYKGYSPEEWLVSWLPTDGGAMLLKEQRVVDIPDGLEAEY